jgi:acetolactate synthase-1/3 small subunit
MSAPDLPLHTLSVLVENKPGVLARVANLFSRRGYNIHSLAVAPTDDEAFSRMTVVVDVSKAPLEQITKQLHKLINVVKITELDPVNSVERELMLIQVEADPGTRAQIIEIADIFRSKVLDVGVDTLTIESTGSPAKLEALEDLLRPYGVIELARTGRVAIPRGTKEPRLKSVQRKVVS